MKPSHLHCLQLLLKCQNILQRMFCYRKCGFLPMKNWFLRVSLNTVFWKKFPFFFFFSKLFSLVFQTTLVWEEGKVERSFKGRNPFVAKVVWWRSSWFVSRILSRYWSRVLNPSAQSLAPCCGLLVLATSEELQFHPNGLSCFKGGVKHCVQYPCLDLNWEVPHITLRHFGLFLL